MLYGLGAEMGSGDLAAGAVKLPAVLPPITKPGPATKEVPTDFDLAPKPSQGLKESPLPPSPRQPTATAMLPPTGPPPPTIYYEDTNAQCHLCHSTARCVMWTNWLQYRMLGSILILTDIIRVEGWRVRSLGGIA